MSLSGYQSFFLFIILLQICILFVTGVFWFLYRENNTIASRRVFFPVVSHVIVLVEIILSISKALVWPDSLFATTLAILLFPILLQKLAWRIFDLYFRWNLSGIIVLRNILINCARCRDQEHQRRYVQ